jgi:hypothetical protein
MPPLLCIWAFQHNDHETGQLVLPSGDWFLVDPTTNVYTADARYQMLTTDGATIYIAASGISVNPTPGQLPSKLYLRNLFETGSEKYYWLNDILTVGVVTLLENDATIQVWQVGLLLFTCAFY